jgi:hypothetical protein
MDESTKVKMGLREVLWNAQQAEVTLNLLQLCFSLRSSSGRAVEFAELGFIMTARRREIELFREASCVFKVLK